MDEFYKFQSYLLGEVRATILPIAEQHKEELGETIWNDLLDLKGKKVIDRKLSKKEIFLRELVHGYVEICDSYKSLKDIQIYIGRFPYRKAGISRVGYLHYHIANYMNEVYILGGRLKDYMKKIGKLYRRDIRHQKILKLTKPIFKLVYNTLSGITKTRGAHVHESRYKDEDLKRLNLLELLTQNDGVDFIEQLPDYYNLEYKKIRRKWKKIIKQNNEELRKLFSIYFDVLLMILFNNDGTLIYPQGISHS
jgi:hypothetical protein